MLKTEKLRPRPKSLKESDNTYQRNRFLTVVKICFAVLGLYAIISRLWAAEDAYITFRYIDNFLQGYGLVYNIGDRVEGFTHPLWLILVTLPAALGIPIRAAALFLSLGLTTAAMTWLALRKENGGGDSVVGIMALTLLLAHTGFRDFCVSGLEFPLVFALMVWFYQSYRRHGLLGKPVLHGSLLAMLYLTRPELALLIATFYLLLGWQLARRYLTGSPANDCPSWSDVGRFTLPILALAGSYHLFRFAYYEAFFANTFYAKDGLGSYWSQGITYFLHFWRYSPILLAATVGWLGLLVSNRRHRERFMNNPANLVMLGQAALLTLYIVKIGGDFMAYRFLLPPMTILVLLISDSFNYLAKSLPIRKAISVALLALAALFVFLPLSAPKVQKFIADERQFYDLYHPAYRAFWEEPTGHPWYQQGLELRQLQQETNYPLMVAEGNIGYLGYAAGPQVTIVDVYGLVDKQAACNWQVVTKRGRPGHELKMTWAMSVERKVAIGEVPFEEWRAMMDTDFGTVMTLDPAFLRHFPVLVQRLKDYKKAVTAGTLPYSQSFEFLRTLEIVYGVQVENL